MIVGCISSESRSSPGSLYEPPQISVYGGAFLAGKHFDEPVIIDRNGNETADPAPMWREPRAALMPMGRYKGAGLCFACELLAGLLSKGGTIADKHPRDGAIVNNMTSFVIDPAALCDLAWMKEEMDAMIDYVKASPQPNPENPVLMPGEIERIRTADREAHGVEISDGEWAAIIKTCRDAGVPESELQA